MNKEFPFDRWWRKHVSPGRFTIFVLALAAFSIFGPMILPLQVAQNICFVALAVCMVCAIPLITWHIYWHVKYPPQIEFCKECGRAKPIKYED